MYNKLFEKILDSSIWMESESTRIVWLTLIASMDEDGYCHFASIGNLANRSRVSVDAAKAAVEIMMAPDPDSSDPSNEGKRIERVPGGWMVLNSVKYRELATRENIKQKTRDRVRAFRDKNSCNAPVTLGNADVTPSDTDTEEKGEIALTRSNAWKDFVEMRVKLKRPLTAGATRAILRKLERFKSDGDDPEEVLLQSVERSWRGIFPLKEGSDGKPKPKKSPYQILDPDDPNNWALAYSEGAGIEK